MDPKSAIAIDVDEYHKLENNEVEQTTVNSKIACKPLCAVCFVVIMSVSLLAIVWSKDTNK